MVVKFDGFDASRKFVKFALLPNLTQARYIGDNMVRNMNKAHIPNAEEISIVLGFVVIACSSKILTFGYHFILYKIRESGAWTGIGINKPIRGLVKKFLNTAVQSVLAYVIVKNKTTFLSFLKAQDIDLVNEVYLYFVALTLALSVLIKLYFSHQKYVNETPVWVDPVAPPS